MEDSDEQRKQWYKTQIDAIIEVIDDMIPVVGKLMDLPVVDKIEQKVIDTLVDVAWEINFNDIDEHTSFMCFSA